MVVIISYSYQLPARRHVWRVHTVYVYLHLHCTLHALHAIRATYTYVICTCSYSCYSEGVDKGTLGILSYYLLFV